MKRKDHKPPSLLMISTWMLFIATLLLPGCDNNFKPQTEEYQPAPTLTETFAPIPSHEVIATSLPDLHGSPTPTLVTEVDIATATLIPQPTNTPKINWDGRLAIIGYPLPDRFPKLYYIESTDLKLTEIYDDIQWIHPPVSWSPDGSTLLFSSLSQNTDVDAFQIYRFVWETRSVSKLDLPVSGGIDRNDPAWSPDGKKIAFTVSGGWPSLIYIMNLENNEISFLTEGYAPRWFPDGERLAFLREIMVEGKFFGGELFFINMDGSGVQQITDDTLRLNLPTIAPNGERIIFSAHDINYTKDGIYSISLKDLTIELLTPEYDNLYPMEWISGENSVIYSYNCQLYRLSLDSLKRELMIGLPSGYCYEYAAVWP